MPVVGVETIIRNGEDVEIQETTGKNVEYVHTQDVIGRIIQGGIATCIIKESGDIMMWREIDIQGHSWVNV